MRLLTGYPSTNVLLEDIPSLNPFGVLDFRVSRVSSLAQGLVQKEEAYRVNPAASEPFFGSVSRPGLPPGWSTSISFWTRDGGHIHTLLIPGLRIIPTPWVPQTVSFLKIKALFLFQKVLLLQWRYSIFKMLVSFLKFKTPIYVPDWYFCVWLIHWILLVGGVEDCGAMRELREKESSGISFLFYPATFVLGLQDFQYLVNSFLKKIY